MYNHYPAACSPLFFIRDVVGDARQMKKLYTYTNLHKKRTFFIVFSAYDVSEDFFEQVVGNE